MDDARADEAPPLPDIATSRPGDLWICGEHRILCGDATKLEAIESVLDGGLADMVFADPPYSVSYVGKTARRLTIKNDDLGAGFYDFLLAACSNLLAVTKGAIYICMSLVGTAHALSRVHRRRRPLVHLHHLGQASFHAGASRLSADV